MLFFLVPNMFVKFRFFYRSNIINTSNTARFSTRGLELQISSIYASLVMEESKPIETKDEKMTDDFSSIICKPIGRIMSCFTEKNGTPRQGLLCTKSKGILTLDYGIPNPQHSVGMKQ